MNIFIKYLFLMLISFTVFAKTDATLIAKHTENSEITKTELRSLIDTILLMGNTIDSLQLERGASTGYISSNGEKFRLKLDKAIFESDLKKHKLLQHIKRDQKVLKRYFGKDTQNRLQDLFDDISSLREKVKNLKINFPKTYSKYTQLIAYLLLNISDISDKVQDRELSNSLYLYSTLLMYKESIGEKRTALSSLFSKKAFSSEIFEYYLTADTQEKIYKKSFLHNADKEIKELYFDTLNVPVSRQVKQYEQTALEKLKGKNVNVDPELWFKSITQKIDLVQKITESVFGKISILVDKLNGINNISFTKDEKEWIKEHKSVKVGVEQWAPVVFLNDSGNIDGIAGDYTKIIMSLSGLKIEIVNDTWNKLLNDFKAKKIDILPATYYTDERAEYGLYTTPYFKMKDYIYVKKDVNNIKALKDLAKKRVAVVKGYGTIPKIQKKYPDIRLIFTDNLDESIKKLLDGDVDALYEGGIAVEQKINDEFITGIKGFPEVSFKTSELYFFSKKDDLILHSILQKSLDSISEEKKKEINSRWFADTSNTNKKLNIAFHYDREPFMFTETSHKGIESDLVKEILQSRGYEVKISQMSKEYLENILHTDSDIDAAASVIRKDDDLFYSDDFISFTNYVITRKEDNIKITSIDDLSKIKFITYKDAYKNLGKKFYDLFNPINGTAKESYDSCDTYENNIDKFFSKKVDAIIIDQKIFQWYLLKHNSRDIYEYHDIFHKSVSFPVAFRSKKVCDDFNKGLKELKKSGRYDEIIHFFLTQDVRPLLKYTNLIADISGKFMFDMKKRELESVLKEFFQHPDVVHIDIYNKMSNENFISMYRKNGSVINDENDRYYKKLPSMQKDIYFSNNGAPLHLGRVNIFYKKSFTNDKADLIPHLNSFTGLSKDDKEKVQKSYAKFGCNTQEIELSKAEKAWLKLHQVVKFTGDPDWLPFEAFDKHGKYIGIVSEYLDKLEHLIGIKFERIATSSWNESVELSQNRDVDVLSETVESDRKHLIFTKPYITNDIVIVMKKDHQYVSGLKSIKNSKIALIKNYGYIKQIKERYPNINFYEVDTVSDGLTAVSTGKTDAFVCTFALGSYTITKMGISNIKIVGKTEFSTSLGLGVRDDYAPLVNILNKAIDSISQKEHNEIFNHWIKQDYVEKIDYSLLYKVGGSAFVLILIFIFWNRKMAQEIGKRKKVEKKLDEERNFIGSIISSSQDALIVIDKNSVITTWNSAAIRLFGYEEREIIGKSVELIIPVKLRKLHHEGLLRVSSGGEEKLIGKGAVEVEGLHKNGHLINIDLALNRFKINNQLFFSASIRDITETKKAQQKLKEAQDKQRLVIEKKVEELTSKQTEHLKDIERSNRLLSGRENRMIELKSEINEYAQRLNLEKPYPIVEKLQNDELSESVINSDEEIDISKLLDIPKLQLLMDEFYNFMHVPLAIIDTKGTILVQSKWSRACTDFHRANTQSCKRCIESDIDISNKRQEGENFSVYKCKNGLIDCASPIIINSKHIANFFIGQFLIHEPDIDFFIAQADEFGYDRQDYLSAIKDAVVIDEDKLPSILGFLKELTEIITILSNEKLNSQRQENEMRQSNIAAMNLAEDAQKATQEIEKYKNHLEDLVQERTKELADEKQFTQTLLDSQDQMIVTTDGEKLINVNRSFLDFYKIESKDEFIKKYHSECICETFSKNTLKGYLQIDMDGLSWIDYIISKPKQTHKAMITIDKDDFIFSVTATKLPGKDRLQSAVFTDITEMENAKLEIESIHKHTKESIEYASLIQGALIPDNTVFKNYFQDYFTLWYPKDTIGGDIYLFEELRDKDECLLMVIDCTGHGVPGAFVTMLVKAIERQITAKINNSDEIVSPANLLGVFNRNMKQLLKQENVQSASNAGFDGAILYYNKKEKIIKFAGAEVPLFYMQNGELKVIKGDRYSVGYKKCDLKHRYTEHIIDIEDGMQFYITTDGYLDQNGGEKGFPFGKSKFKNIIKEHHQKMMTDQKEIFLNTLSDYQGDEDTNDDITLIGFKI